MQPSFDNVDFFIYLHYVLRYDQNSVLAGRPKRLLSQHEPTTGAQNMNTVFKTINTLRHPILAAGELLWINFRCMRVFRVTVFRVDEVKVIPLKKKE